MASVGHFGERFRSGQYTLVSFLFAPRCPPCQAICKSGGTPPCPVVPDPVSGARPLGDGVGSQGSKGRKSLSLVQGQSTCIGSGSPFLSQLVPPCPNGESCMLVSLTCLGFISIQLVGFTCCYKAVVWLSKGLQLYCFMHQSMMMTMTMQAYLVALERI